MADVTRWRPELAPSEVDSTTGCIHSSFAIGWPARVAWLGRERRRLGLDEFDEISVESCGVGLVDPVRGVVVLLVRHVRDKSGGMPRRDVDWIVDVTGAVHEQ